MMRQQSIILWFALMITCWSEEFPDLKMVKNRVTIEFDGQPLKLWVDTGSTRLLVVDKKSFEDIHGKGTCEKLSPACYSCPVDRPCDFGHAPRYSVTYSSLKVLEYVIHKGTLLIGDVEIPNFVFGIIVNITINGEPVKRPEGQLGLSFGRPDIPETFLEQLRDRGLIRSLSFSINTPTWWIREGSLTLGRLSGPQISWKFTSIVRDHDSAIEKFFVRVSAIRVIQGERPIMSVTPKRDLAFVDSGNELIRVPSEVYRHIATGVDPTQIASGRGILNRDDIPRLPDLEFTIVDAHGDPFVLRVSMKDYVFNYPGDRVAIHIKDADSFIFLGQPLFRAYSIYFDMGNKKVAFREKNQAKLVLRGGAVVSV